MAALSVPLGRWPAGPGSAPQGAGGGACPARRGAPGPLALLLGAVALAARAASQGFAAAASRAAEPRGPGAGRRATAAGGGPDADVWKEAAADGASPAAGAGAKGAPPLGLKEADMPLGAEYVPDSPEASSSSRIKQFLALEPIPDDPSQGNQWEVDSKSGTQTSQDEWKKIIAIGTGGVSIFVALAYLIWVIAIENRDFEGDLALSKEDIESISSLFPDGE
ncbi:unnamed protein product [Prorocentrum cordatum]|uniref:Mitochondrial import inner membrane translocase subunit Tim21 n=1 Tax=Prorocentrum cordatum TaxID=2364126 RepID=A0ABN9Y2F1_9DINO|nr:unnamed protein product [Polarella glacialis]